MVVGFVTTTSKALPAVVDETFVTLPPPPPEYIGMFKTPPVSVAAPLPPTVVKLVNGITGVAESIVMLLPVSVNVMFVPGINLILSVVPSEPVRVASTSDPA